MPLAVEGLYNARVLSRSVFFKGAVQELFTLREYRLERIPDVYDE